MHAHIGSSWDCGHSRGAELLEKVGGGLIKDPTLSVRVSLSPSGLASDCLAEQEGPHREHQHRNGICSCPRCAIKNHCEPASKIAGTAVDVCTAGPARRALRGRSHFLQLSQRVTLRGRHSRRRDDAAGQGDHGHAAGELGGRQSSNCVGEGRAVEGPAASSNCGAVIDAAGWECAEWGDPGAGGRVAVALALSAVGHYPCAQQNGQRNASFRFGVRCRQRPSKLARRQAGLIQGRQAGGVCSVQSCI